MKPAKPTCCSCSLIEASRVTRTVGRALVSLADFSLCLDVRTTAIDGQLIVLMPEKMARQELVARVEVFESKSEVLLRVLGWLTPVFVDERAAVAARFSERHLTTDLLDLGSTWTLMQLDPADAWLIDHQRELPLQPEQLRIAWSLPELQDEC